MNRRVAPVENGVIGDIHQTHRAARMCLACCANGLATPIRKGEFLQMTSGTGRCAVHREPFLIEQVAAQLHLQRAHRIAGGNRRRGKSLWQGKIESCCHCSGGWRRPVRAPAKCGNRRQAHSRSGPRDAHWLPQLMRATLDNAPFTVTNKSVSPMPRNSLGSSTVTWSRPVLLSAPKESVRTEWSPSVT